MRSVNAVSEQKRILLADDEENLAGPLREEFLAAGYIVDVACDGVEAVMKAADNVYAIALLDMAMPKLDGLHTIRILRKMNKKMPIIAMSGSMHHERLSETISAGALMFVHKPFNTQWLLTQVKWVVGG
ncbi:MAG: response regulator [Deltaproteobacteria bacterium]|nr:response regulator [Deltaproteobacteria bacterium]